MDSTVEAQIFTPPISSEVEISADINGLLPLLQRLDQRLQRAISALKTQEKELKPNWFEQSEILPLETTSIQIREDSALAWLQKNFSLSVVDLELLAIALAPELDRQYVKIYAYLQDDQTQKKPTVDLALNLLCSTFAEKLSYRQHFTTTAPLISHRLLHLTAESITQPANLLEHTCKLDDQVVRFLLQQPGLDFRLTSCCQLIQPGSSYHKLYSPPEIQIALEKLILSDWQQQQSRLLYFSGIDRTSKRHTVENLATTLNVSLLVADLGKMIEDKARFQEKLGLIWREARFFAHLLYLDNFDLLYLQENQLLDQLCLTQLAQNQGITILAGVESWKPSATGEKGIITIPFTIPEVTQRRHCWQTNLQETNISLEERELELLSDRFRLTPEQIADAVATAQNNTHWQLCQTNSVDNSAEKENEHNNLKPQLSSFSNLCHAARTQSSLDLGSLAYKIEPKYTWDDIILRPNQLKQLQDICKESEYRDLVHRQWGFADKLSLGKGLNVLFSGASGTGKTMAAEVIAHHLQLDLYKIDLSQIISKYIGETEKNLNRIFTAATNSNAILLFDEADALFGKRSEVQDARDRYANIEVGYLLQKMEEYEGITILTTNLRDNIDKAFERRLRFIVKFNLPDVQSRHVIWQKIIPLNAPCSSLDLKFLAQNFEITGASIRNVALTAAFLAADDGEIIEMNHIIKAIQREYQKIGKILRDRDLGKYAAGATTDSSNLPI